MQDRIYLLSIGEFLEEAVGDALMGKALAKVDENRRKKAERIRQPKAKAACIGAGLLLQYVVRVAIQDGAGIKDGAVEPIGEEIAESISIHNSLTKLPIRDLMSEIEVPIPLEFTYGKSGKPYLKENPFYFNLSHSGEYVVCVVSEQEIGVDIQEHRGGNTERIAKRYFAPREIQVLEECQAVERTQCFFDMWAGKEAFGKYTGNGIAESLETEIPANRVELQLIHNIPGYSLAVCKGVE